MENYRYLITEQLNTKDLIVRHFQQADLESYFEFTSVFGVTESAGWEHFEKIDESSKYLEHMMKYKFNYAIALKEKNKVIGSISLTELEDNSIRLGFMLSKNYWNKGYMNQVVKRVVDYVFCNTSYKKFVAGHFDNNIGSKKVLLKCGFTFVERVKSTVKFMNAYVMVNNYELKKLLFYKFKRYWKEE